VDDEDCPLAEPVLSNMFISSEEDEPAAAPDAFRRWVCSVTELSPPRPLAEAALSEEWRIVAESPAVAEPEP
jgi:hypothetical protein